MGLDDFMELDVESEGSSESSSTDSEESELVKYDNWVKGEDSKPQRRGIYGYSDKGEYENTIEGKMESHGDLFKYYLPIFPHIEIEERYERGKRYKFPKDMAAMSCVSHLQTQLHKVNREMVMLDTGRTEKKECLEALSERFGKEIAPDTEVHLYFFAKMRHVVKMAMGDEFVDSWGLENKDRLLKAVHGETWTQEFREKNTGERDLKHLDEMKEW